MKENKYVKGRGAQINPANPFHAYSSEEDGLKWNDDDELNELKTTQYIPNDPKTILNKVDSPDIGHSWSMNPYQGCEHGCIYCYARNTHNYWGYSSGIEFEQKILVKEKAPDLLEKRLKSKKWNPLPIMFSGNTDCYQPAEKKYGITRKMLEILWKYRHPVGIITKSQLVLRDLDILRKLASEDLVHVAVSVTTLDEQLRQKLEPRTATATNRLKVIGELSNEGIPVNAMMAPIIPSINDHEIFEMAKRTAEAGAQAFNHIVVRLNGDIGILFKDWLEKNYPARYQRVLKQIESCHGGKLNDSRFGKRMKGEGNVAEIIGQQMKRAREKYFKGRKMKPYNTSLYAQHRDRQLSLF